MRKSRLKQLLGILAILLVIYPTLPVQAKVQSFSSMHMELTLPENALVLTKDIPNTDTQWKDAGITDPKSEKSNYESMGVQALIYDPNTSTSVRILQKQSKNSKEIFHLSQLSETEFNNFLDTFVTLEDENSTYSIEKYPHPETPFFRFELNMTKDGNSYTEIIYGTIVNGDTISFDIYQQNPKAPIDESFIKELVAGSHFTDFFDKAEVEKAERNATIASIVILLLVVIVIVLWIVLRKKRKAKHYAFKRQRSQELAEFFTKQRQKEEQNAKDTPKLANRTLYSEAVIKQFTTYDRFLHHLPVWIISLALFILLIGTLYVNGSYFGLLIAIVLFIVFLYFQGFQYEKAIIKTMRSYKDNKSMEAIFTFYEDYYTLTGIQSSSKYPYIQITEVKEYKDFVYIYLGEDKAHYLKKDGFDKDYNEFKKLMKDRM